MCMQSGARTFALQFTSRFVMFTELDSDYSFAVVVCCQFFPLLHSSRVAVIELKASFDGF
jgi:hypothetical protein